MATIVERLRRYRLAGQPAQMQFVNPDGPEAADTIELLVEALEKITDCYGVGYKSPAKFCEAVHDFMEEGRAALAKVRAG